MTAEDTIFYLKNNCTDKYLIDYMRLKIIDKSGKDNNKEVTFNSASLHNLSLPVNEDGYLLLIEGAMPYNTTEGQIQLELLSNEETFELTEIIGCEPIEYQDAYVPFKYGIIFKEKIFTSPTEHTLAACNVRLLKNGASLDSHGLLRQFKVQILDNDKCIFEKSGWNQIDFSNFVFR